MVECEHDWRVNPFVKLLSDPPRDLLVCTKCPETRSRPTDRVRPAHTQDTDTWPKA